MFPRQNPRHRPPSASGRSRAAPTFAAAVFSLAALCPAHAQTTSVPTSPTPPAAPAILPASPAWKPGDYFPPNLGPWPTERITPLLQSVSPEHLRRWHDLLASEPHIAGTPGDLRQVDRIAKAFANMGLEVEKHEIWVYLSRPVSAVLELITPGDRAQPDSPPNRKPLVLKEQVLPEDADSATPDISWGWNAYSGNGDVTAEIVYANQGTKADFAKLKELAVDLRGKIVLCRYGGNFRGYKVKFAEAAGAAGVVIFVDGGDGKLAAYPSGAAPNDSCIERGSINTLDYPGDPLTPGVEAREDAERIDSATVALPKIPVQPIGWGAAREILLRMAEGEASQHPSISPPLPDGWQAKLPVPCTVVGPPSVKLRLKVEQAREITRTVNVIGTLPGLAPAGTRDAERWVIVGSHHDAWGFGACDPTCGTIVTMESARVFAEAAKAGNRPRRTMKFCTWAAEEFSIIGSTEWVEANREKLEKDGVAYINLDNSVMGPKFGSSAAPSLKTVITEVSRHVPALGSRLEAQGSVAGPTVFDTWISREPDPRLPGQPKFGDLGGGSDHVAFWCHAGVPSCSMGSSGAQGTAYHSIYDTLAWYRQNVSDDYLPAQMVTRMVVGTLARLADDEVVPLDPGRNWFDAAGHAGAIRGPLAALDPALADWLERIAARLSQGWIAPRELETPLTGASDAASAVARAANTDFVSNWRMLQGRTWVKPGSMPGREWYVNLLMSPDADSGYASWPLPPIMQAVAKGDASMARDALGRYESLLDQRGAVDRPAPPAAAPSAEGHE